MADKGGIKILKYYTQKLKTFFLSKDILSFLLFIALSSVFWFVHVLGKERETTLTIPIRYVGIPLNVAVTNTPPSVIKVSIKDQGLRLLDYSRKPMTPLTIDLKRTFYQKGEILITADELTSRISRYMHMQQTSTVLEVRPDSLQIQYQRLSSKKLPVRLVSKIETAGQYMISGQIRLEPQVVTVFGPKHVLETMTFANTEFVEYRNLNDTISAYCKLKPRKQVRYSYDKIRMTVFVEPYTERKVQLPVTSVNCPPDLSIRTFPAYVIATYTVGLSNFNKFDANDIQVYLDYNDLKASKLSKRLLKIKNNSSHISNIRLSPLEVEFILEQK